LAEPEPLGTPPAWWLVAEVGAPPGLDEADVGLGWPPGLDVAEVALCEGLPLDSLLLLAEGAAPLPDGAEVADASSLSDDSVFAAPGPGPTVLDGESVSSASPPSPDTKETLGPEGLLPSPRLPPLGTTGWMETSCATMATDVSAIHGHTHGAGAWL
jgi:hypothetical protein